MATPWTFAVTLALVQRGPRLRKVEPRTRGCTAVRGSAELRTRGGLFSGSLEGLPLPVPGLVREKGAGTHI